MENLDEMYMKMALELAEKGAGQVSPNPMVGAVIGKEGRVIGQDCRESPEGAVMYVTLEPCCHHGHQPPCTDAILEAGIRRVVSGCKDPNPLVGGKGIRLLRDHGVEVTEGVLEEECRALNRVFFHFIRTKRPYVTMKYAMTMDGKIAAFTGASRWITDEEARAHVHLQRSRNRGIMAGIGTVLADDPLLTCRMEGGQNRSALSATAICVSPWTAGFFLPPEMFPRFWPCAMNRCSRRAQTGQARWKSG